MDQEHKTTTPPTTATANSYNYNDNYGDDITTTKSTYNINYFNHS